jgi:hypothetical protein
MAVSKEAGRGNLKMNVLFLGDNLRIFSTKVCTFRIDALSKRSLSDS